MFSNVDIRNCEPEYFNDDEMVRQYVIQLCDILDLQRCGDVEKISSGHGSEYPCYSMTQLEKALVTIHFSESKKIAHIDVFSTKYYDPEIVAHFSICYFKGTDYGINVLIRQ